MTTSGSYLGYYHVFELQIDFLSDPDPSTLGVLVLCRMVAVVESRYVGGGTLMQVEGLRAGTPADPLDPLRRSIITRDA